MTCVNTFNCLIHMDAGRRQKDMGIRCGKDRQRVGCQRLRKLALRKETSTERESETGNTKRRPTYQSTTLAKNWIRRKRMEDMDDPLDRSHDFSAVLSKSGNGTSLILKNFHDRVDSIAILELQDEGMVDQFQPRLFFIALQRGVEE